MKFPDPFKLLLQYGRIPQISCPDAFPAGIQRIFIRRTNTHSATSVTAFSPGNFPDAVRRLVKGRDDQRAITDAQARKHIAYPLTGQYVTFNQQSPGMDNDIR